MDERNEFVILNVGRKNGLLPGRVMIVGRGLNCMGMIKIDKVLDDMAIADILKLDNPQIQIQVGDFVILEEDFLSVR